MADPHKTSSEITKSPKVSHFSGQAFNNTWKTVQTRVDNYQQTTRPDYYISALNQKIITPHVYVTAEELELRRLKAIITIQKHVRRWLARRERDRRMEELVKKVDWAEQLKKARIEGRRAVKEDELWRQKNPTRMVDVELLYRGINDWRNKEIEYINQHRWGADRKAALAEIMEKEADLLLDLERTKTAIRKNLRDSFIERIFKKMGDPTRWKNKKGHWVSMDNEDKAKMRHYHTLYNELKEAVVDIEKRLNILNRILETIANCNARSAKNLTALIHREFQFIEFNAGPRLTVGLRQRILNTFYSLLRDPSFNPEATKLQKIPYESKKLRKEMVQCKGCRKMQHRTQFSVARGTTNNTRCKECTAFYKTSIVRSDLNLYRRMLAELRHDEKEAGVTTSVTFLMDANDLQFLIEQLWHAQSVLSGETDRYMLRICRWNKIEPWTPWNCILLTEEEAVVHLQLESLEGAYRIDFIRRVELKHQVAKIYFARLSTLSLSLDPVVLNMCENLKIQAAAAECEPKPPEGESTISLLSSQKHAY